MDEGRCPVHPLKTCPQDLLLWELLTTSLVKKHAPQTGKTRKPPSFSDEVDNPLLVYRNIVFLSEDQAPLRILGVSTRDHPSGSPSSGSRSGWHWVNLAAAPRRRIRSATRSTFDPVLGDHRIVRRSTAERASRCGWHQHRHQLLERPPSKARRRKGKGPW